MILILWYCVFFNFSQLVTLTAELALPTAHVFHVFLGMSGPCSAHSCSPGSQVIRRA